MSTPLANATFRRLFAAQICSLIGIGLLTVALSLTAYRLGGDAAAGRILGLLLALKMIAYVALAPLAEGLLSGMPRKRSMVWLDLGRMLLLVPMGFAAEGWHIAVLAFVFFALSAGFTPLFQSVIPDVLPDEATYSRALAWSRIAYTLEAVLSPVIAAVLLNIVVGSGLFLVAAVMFAGSILALLLTRFPERAVAARRGPFLRRVSRGMFIYLRTPRLRGLFLLNFALSIAMAWVLVNTVGYAGARLGDAEHFFPILMAFYGLGAALGAFFVPRMVEGIGERRTMASGTFAFAAVGLCFASLHAVPFAVLAGVWTCFGASSSLVLTPGGLVIARSAAREDRAAVFAAQFSLSHAGWLVAYPAAGFLVGWISLEAALFLLSLLCAGVTLTALRVWPANDPSKVFHSHPDLPADHAHLREISAKGADHRHAHVFYIDDLHAQWVRSSDPR
jgi:MFS family permease